MRILIADDHPLYLDAVLQRTNRTFPEADICTASSAAALMQLLAEEPANLVVTDYSMPGMEGINSIQGIVAEAAGAPVIVMSGLPSQINVMACLDAGVKGFLPKTLDAAVFSAAVALVMSGGTYVPTDLMVSMQAEDESKAHFGLSPREREILQMVVSGASNKEIARDFDVEEVTVKFHLSKIFKKLDVKNRSQAAVMAIRHGIVA